MQWAGYKQKGFTIVELLIVIVVIAILAAITIVAYNGVSRQAKASAAQSAAQQAVKKIALYAVDNAGSFPANLALIGVVDSDSTSYQYSVNNGVAPPTYCATVTVSNVSYFVSSTQTNPQAGGCPGHGQGGVASVTNLATNPSFEITTGTSVEVRRNHATIPVPTASAGWSSNDGALYTRTFDATGGRRSGTGAAKFTRTATNPTSVIASAYGAGIPAWNVSGRTPVVAGETWTVSAYGTADRSFSTSIQVRFYDAAGVQVGTSQNSSLGTGSSMQWVRASLTATVPAGATNMGLIEHRFNLQSGQTVGGEQAWMTDALFEKVSVLTDYFDGAFSPDTDLVASWTGTPSTSASILSGGRVNQQVGSPLLIRSSQWTKSGSYSGRHVAGISPTGGKFSEFLSVSGAEARGKTYTIIATSRALDAMPGSTYNRRLTVRTYGAATPLLDGPSAANGAGEEQLRWTVTIPNDPAITSIAVRLYTTSAAGVYAPDHWWDNLMIVEGNYSGATHDGDSQDWIWNGTPHISTSTGPGI